MVSTSSGPVPPTVATSYQTNSGVAVPAANILNVLGSSGVATSGAGNTVTITLTQIAPSYVNVTPNMSPYVVTATDYFISCDPTADGGGPIVIQLPNSPTQYDQYVVKDRTAGILTNPAWTVTVTTVGGVVTIDGSTSAVYSDPYESLELLFNGTTYESF